MHDFGGQGPAIVLGHGNGLNAGMWRAALPGLKSQFHVYGVDLRGHGACRPVNPDYSVDRYRLGEDLMAVVDHLDRPVAYAGHSLGGAAAIYGSLARSDLFSAMWLFEPVVIPSWFERSAPPSQLVEMTRRRRHHFDSPQDAFDRFVAKAPFDRCDPQAVRGYVELGTQPVDGGVALSCHPENEARVFGSGQPLDFNRLGTITTPTVVAAGEEVEAAHSIPAQMAAPIARALGAARLELHPGIGHFGPMEAPHELARSIIAHFEAHHEH